MNNTTLAICILVVRFRFHGGSAVEFHRAPIRSRSAVGVALGALARYASRECVPKEGKMSLEETPQTQKHDVVLIHLESTCPDYHAVQRNLNTMPFLDERLKRASSSSGLHGHAARFQGDRLGQLRVGLHLVEEITEARPNGGHGAAPDPRFRRIRGQRTG